MRIAAAILAMFMLPSGGFAVDVSDVGHMLPTGLDVPAGAAAILFDESGATLQESAAWISVDASPWNFAADGTTASLAGAAIPNLSWEFSLPYVLGDVDGDGHDDVYVLANTTTDAEHPEVSIVTRDGLTGERMGVRAFPTTFFWGIDIDAVANVNVERFRYQTGLVPAGGVKLAVTTEVGYAEPMGDPLWSFPERVTMLDDGGILESRQSITPGPYTASGASVWVVDGRAEWHESLFNTTWGPSNATRYSLPDMTPLVRVEGAPTIRGTLHTMPAWSLVSAESSGGLAIRRGDNLDITTAIPVETIGFVPSGILLPEPAPGEDPVIVVRGAPTNGTVRLAGVGSDGTRLWETQVGSNSIIASLGTSIGSGAPVLGVASVDFDCEQDQFIRIRMASINALSGATQWTRNTPLLTSTTYPSAFILGAGDLTGDGVGESLYAYLDGVSRDGCSATYSPAFASSVIEYWASESSNDVKVLTQPTDAFFFVPYQPDVRLRNLVFLQAESLTGWPVDTMRLTISVHNVADGSVTETRVHTRTFAPYWNYRLHGMAALDLGGAGESVLVFWAAASWEVVEHARSGMHARGVGGNTLSWDVVTEAPYDITWDGILP